MMIFFWKFVATLSEDFCKRSSETSAFNQQRRSRKHVIYNFCEKLSSQWNLTCMQVSAFLNNKFNTVGLGFAYFFVIIPFMHKIALSLRQVEFVFCLTFLEITHFYWTNFMWLCMNVYKKKVFYFLPKYLLRWCEF